MRHPREYNFVRKEWSKLTAELINANMQCHRHLSSRYTTSLELADTKYGNEAPSAEVLYTAAAIFVLIPKWSKRQGGDKS